MIEFMFSYFMILNILWCSYPQRVSKRKASVRHMFYNPEDVKWFKVKITQHLDSLNFSWTVMRFAPSKLVSIVSLISFLMWLVIAAY